MAACSPARDIDASYHAYGHSLLVDPMGQICAELDENEGTLDSEIVISNIEDARFSIPVGKQRRFDIYPDVSAGF